LVLCCLAVGGLRLLGQALRQWERRHDQVGRAELRLQLPTDLPMPVTVRLPLSADFRATYPEGPSSPEAGVLNVSGDRVFYVTAVASSVPPGAAGDPLDRYASAAGRNGDPTVSGVREEFRVTPRGRVWFQRYTDAAPDLNPFRPAGTTFVGVNAKLDVLRYAEAWRGQVIEYRFLLRHGRASELEPLVWGIVEGAEVVGGW
jgi:hypothetical protein